MNSDQESQRQEQRRRAQQMRDLAARVIDWLLRKDQAKDAPPPFDFIKLIPTRCTIAYDAQGRVSRITYS